MADSSGSGSKTEKATPKKRRDQRKEGNVLQSRDVAGLVTLAGTFFALSIFLEGAINSIAQFMVRFIDLAGTVTDTTMGNVGSMSSIFMVALAKSLVPFLLVCVLLGVVGSGMQTRFLFATKNLKPKFSRLNPLEGLKKLFSMQNLVELVKSLLKLIVLIALTYSMLKADMAGTVKTMSLDIPRSVAFTFTMLKNLLIRIIIAFVAIAALDYLYQWWSFERKMMMSKQEVKEEYKQTEGNPEIKGRIKNIQQQRARMRMMQAVPDADVIIRNPTHFAVALKYDIDKNSAPVVLAKGQDELALRIIDVGEENKVPIVENRPLARALYQDTEINGEIPQEHYGAVAEILVYIYKMNEKME